MADEAFHEIQLNGKQLVFLFMAATVVAVVIFLCGVMVGRGVRTNRAELARLSTETPADPTADVQPAAARATAGATASPATQENLSYPDRLASRDLAPETLKEPTPARSADIAIPPAAARRNEIPPLQDFTVQVAAIRERNEADTIVRRLTAKGYAAYVMAPDRDAPRVYRVRVGKFKERREAETVATRLEREEQFKPWITR
jgi:cell division septation protein DedD